MKDITEKTTEELKAEICYYINKIEHERKLGKGVELPKIKPLSHQRLCFYGVRVRNPKSIVIDGKS